MYCSSWPTPLWKLGTPQLLSVTQESQWRKARPASHLKLEERANSTSPDLFVPLGPSASWTLPPHWGGQSAFLSLPIQTPRTPSQTHPGIPSAWAPSGPVKVKGKAAHLRATLSGRETGLVGDTWQPVPHKGEHNARGTERGECELISRVHLAISNTCGHGIHFLGQE